MRVWKIAGMSEKCDAEVFAKGEPLLAMDGWAEDVEPWVQKVAKRSGQRVDWHYSGGVAQVLVLGDRAKAMRAVDELESDLALVNTRDERQPHIMRRYTSSSAGLYRAGVTPAPEGAIGAVTTSGETVWIK
jgi:hypothetical protein